MRKVLYILGQLEDTDLQWIVDAGSLRSVAPNTVIIEDGVPLESLFIVVTGELAVLKGGREIARLSAGEIVGDMSFIDGRPASATVRTEGAGLVYAVPNDRLRAKLDRDAPFAARFYRALCLFLVERLARTNALVNGVTVSSDSADDKEIAPDTLQRVAIAGARFDWFLQRMRGA